MRITPMKPASSHSTFARSSRLGDGTGEFWSCLGAAAQGGGAASSSIAAEVIAAALALKEPAILALPRAPLLPPAEANITAICGGSGAPRQEKSALEERPRQMRGICDRRFAAARFASLHLPDQPDVVIFGPAGVQCLLV